MKLLSTYVNTLNLILFFLPITLSVYSYNLTPLTIAESDKEDSHHFNNPKALLSGERTTYQYQQQGSGKILDTLRQIPGVQIIQTGAPAGNASINFRGADARHLLILINGVRFNDPSTVNRESNLAVLDLANIKAIEVYRGAQSVIYGADAMMGVINIITDDKVTNLNLYQGLGQKMAGQIFHDFGDTSLSLSATNRSALAPSTQRAGSEKDYFEEQGTRFTLTRKITPSGRLKFTTTKITQNQHFDNSPTDEENVYGLYDQQMQTLQISERSGDFSWQLQSFQSQIDRPQTLGSFGPQRHKAKEFGNDAFVKYHFKRHYFLLGLSRLTERFTQDHFSRWYSASSNDFYTGAHLTLTDQLSFDLSQRQTTHSAFKTQNVYAARLSYSRDKYELNLNYSEGFKPPSLYQLYGEDLIFGKNPNEELSPELSTTKEIEVHYFLDKDYLNKITLRHHDSIVKDFIININDFSTPINGEEVKWQGQELLLSNQTKDYQWEFSSELFRYEDSTPLRRPLNRAKLSVVIPVQDISYRFHLRHVGARRDWDFTDFANPELVELPAYTILDSGVTHNLNTHGEVTYGVNNLLNQTYEEVVGFQGLPLTLYVDWSKRW